MTVFRPEICQFFCISCQKTCFEVCQKGANGRHIHTGTGMMGSVLSCWNKLDYISNPLFQRSIFIKILRWKPYQGQQPGVLLPQHHPRTHKKHLPKAGSYSTGSGSTPGASGIYIDHPIKQVIFCWNKLDYISNPLLFQRSIFIKILLAYIYSLACSNISCIS
jgi:hypothetical protein